MINLKEQYKVAKLKALELMNKGLLAEYIQQLNYANSIRVKLIKG